MWKRKRKNYERFYVRLWREERKRNVDGIVNVI